MRFDHNMARLTLELSAIAYRDEGPARGDVLGLGLTDFAFFDGTSTQAVYGRDQDHQFLAFRGTEANPLDWVKDAQFAPRPGVFGTDVHYGFKTALDEVWDPVTASLSTSGLPLVATGHSLGAALAALAAARFSEAGGQVAAVYNYGQPRVGHSPFRSAYDERLLDVTFRVVNHIDLVTRVPLLVQGYRHVGRRMYFDEHGRLHEDASALKIATDDVSFRLRHWGRIKAAGLDPHMMNPYRERFAALPDPATPQSTDR